MNEIEKIIQKQLDYYNANDLEGFISTYHEDIEIRHFEDNTLILSGKNALEIKYRERFEVHRVHAEIVNRMIIGNKVIDYEHVSGIKKDEIVKVIAVYKVEENLIKTVWFLYE